MSTITAVVHTKNSARTLAACLDSLTWCDEVFVVDMESDDETLAIAKSKKATVFHEKAALRFADPIRDQYLRKVKTDWTIIVDSDEEVPKTLASKVQTLIQSTEFEGYNVPRKNIIFGKWIEHTGFWPDYILRLFKTGKGSYPPYVHSQPVVEGSVANITPTEEFALIHHHYESIEQFLLRLNVYTTLEVEKAMEAGNATLPPQNLIQAFFDQFFTRFFAQKGYKDGSHGLVLSLLMAVYTMVVQMKFWEKQKDKKLFGDDVLTDVELAINDGCRGTMYWVANEELQKPHSFFSKLKLLFRRKVNS